VTRAGGPELGADVPEAVLRMRDRYRRRADRGLMLFRLSGAVLIVLGGVMPVLTVADYPFKTAVVSVAGVAISLSAGLHAFFRWDRQWQLLRNAQFRLEEAYLEWSLQVAKVHGLSEEERRKMLARADRKLFDQYRSVRNGESKEFFALLHFPGRGAERTGAEP